MNGLPELVRIIRKTSMDELPQFINVLKGEMSVVGPRPHMVSHTQMYAERIDKFMVRHFIKPGITGLAQVSGYRGEVETDNDIIKRVKFDIFYLENWSLLLDLKIVFQTVYQCITRRRKSILSLRIILLVSIITPLYNAEKYIAETISSVQNQTYSNWELIIVDDASTDASVKIAEAFANQG